MLCSLFSILSEVGIGLCGEEVLEGFEWFGWLIARGLMDVVVEREETVSDT